MSVTPMKKLTALSHRADADKLVRRLMALRCVDVAVAEPTDETLSMLRCEEEIRALEEEQAGIRAAIVALSPYSKRKKGLFAPKPDVDRDRFVTEGLAEQAKFTVRAANAAVSRQNEIKNEIITKYYDR